VRVRLHAFHTPLADEASVAVPVSMRTPCASMCFSQQAGHVRVQNLLLHFDDGHAATTRDKGFRRFDNDEAATHDRDVVGAPGVEMTADAFRVTHPVRREYVGEVRAGSDGLIGRAPVAGTSLS